MVFLGKMVKFGVAQTAMIDRVNEEAIPIQGNGNSALLVQEDPNSSKIGIYFYFEAVP